MTATPQQPILAVGALTLPRPRTVRAPGRGRRRLTDVLVTLVAVAAVALAAALTVVPALVGGHTLTVLSGSMSPAIPTGSVVAVRPVDPRAVTVGDIVTYGSRSELTGRPELVTHRVTAIERGADGPMFTFKGDANQIADAATVSARQIVGKVWYHVPAVGYARDAVFTRTGALFAVAFALLALGFVLLRRIGRSVRGTEARVSRHG